MTDELALSLTPEQYKSHETGAKWLFAGWYIYVSLIWSLKGIMLSFFSRVTYVLPPLITRISEVVFTVPTVPCRKTLPEERLVKVVSVITAAAYLATLAVITGHCRPISRLWQVYPYAGGTSFLVSLVKCGDSDASL